MWMYYYLNTTLHILRDDLEKKKEVTFFLLRKKQNKTEKQKQKTNTPQTSLTYKQRE